MSAELAWTTSEVLRQVFLTANFIYLLQVCSNFLFLLVLVLVVYLSLTLSISSRLSLIFAYNHFTVFSYNILS